MRNNLELKTTLRNGLEQLKIQLQDEQVEKLLAYTAELYRWNKAYNLTAIRDPEKMLYLHLLDSLAILPLLQGTNFADIGTGPGIPGIPLAIACPDRKFQLIDSNGKKMRFVFQTCLKLGIKNVQEKQIRVEEFQPMVTGGYDGVISRAFTSVPEMLEKCHHLVANGGCFYAMKGKVPADELRDIEKHYKVVACHELQVPGIDAERHLIEIVKN